MNTTPIVIVAGISKKDRGLGKDNELLWHVPEDLKRFRKLTAGHPIIMGRKTFESILDILGKPLPGRTNIVITRDTSYTYPGITVVHSLEDAIKTAQSENPTEIHIGGGAEIYRQVLPLVNRLHITWFYGEKEADTFFPAFEEAFTVSEEHPTQEHEGLSYQWIDYVSKID